MPPQDVIRVLLVDDQRLMLDGISALLAEYADLDIVGLASNGQEAIELAAQKHPDVILLDIRMPVMDGIRALKALRAEHPSCKILMLTTFEDDDYIVEALQNGAIGYLLKDLPALELAQATRAAHRGVYSFDPRTGKRIAQLVVSRPDKRLSHGSEEFYSLSEREQEVMLLVARGYSNREIAAKLSITEGTVKNHLSNIFASLNLTGRAQIIAYTYKHNLIAP
jgi:DNA-binding NarL/FixJ family response regulator